MQATEKLQPLQEGISTDGFAIVPNALPEREVAELLAVLEQSELPPSRAGMRPVMRNESVAAIARDSRLAALAQEVLGDASSKSQSAAPRRVLHIEYATPSSFGEGLELAIA
jgi:hypothetical protein